MRITGTQRRPITLGDDGELHQLIGDPATRRDAIFCVHCSKPNSPGAHFCSQCGGSLLEQQLDTPPLGDPVPPKRKHDQDQNPRLAMYDPTQYDLVKKKPLRSEGNAVGLFIVIVVVSGWIMVTLPPNQGTLVLACLLVTAVIYGVSKWASPN